MHIIIIYFEKSYSKEISFLILLTTELVIHILNK